MSSAATDADMVLEIGPAGITALKNALDRQLGRYKGTLQQHRSANAPDSHSRDIRRRAAALAELASAAAEPDRDDVGRPIVTHTPASPELLHDELARLYAEFGPESRPDASRRADDLSTAELARLLAGYGHRA